LRLVVSFLFAVVLFNVINELKFPQGFHTKIVSAVETYLGNSLQELETKTLGKQWK